MSTPERPAAAPATFASELLRRSKGSERLNALLNADEPAVAVAALTFSEVFDLVHAVGFGIRYRTPIGPVRIDLAFTPNSPRFNGFEGSRQDLLFGRGRAAELRVNQFQFHISLGQAF